MLQIKLKLNTGKRDAENKAIREEKTYMHDYISGLMFRKTVEMQTVLKDGMDVAAVDKVANYVVELFEKQFTVDQFYDGIEANKLISTFTC